MVLQELGSRITGVLGQLGKAPVDTDSFDNAMKEICHALITADVAIPLVQQLRSNIRSRVLPALEAGGINKVKLVREEVVRELIKLVDPGKEAYQPKKRLNHTAVIMAVGLQGAGKTTTLSKMARHYVRRKWKVGVVCCDTFRAGAYDQLSQNCSKVGAEFYGSLTDSDAVAIASLGVSHFKDKGFDIVFVDTAGRHQQDEALFQEMDRIAQAVKPDDITFVMDGSIGQAAKEQAEAFSARVTVGSVIITKMDGHAKGGGALTAVAYAKAPIVFLGMGEGMDALTPFDPQGFISRMLGMADLKGLVNQFKKDGEFAGLMELAKDVQATKTFTLTNLQDMLREMLEMGNMDQLLAMIPGFAGLGEQAAALSGGNMKYLTVMLDSLTKAEMTVRCEDAKKYFSEARRRRIAGGCGLPLAAVTQFLGHCAMLGGILESAQKLDSKELAKSVMPGKMNAKHASTKAFNDIAKMLPPEALNMLGGRGGLSTMLQQADAMESAMKGGGGGAGSMAAQMAQMQQMLAGGAGGRGGRAGARRGRR